MNVLGALGLLRVIALMLWVFSAIALFGSLDTSFGLGLIPAGLFVWGVAAWKKG